MTRTFNEAKEKIFKVDLEIKSLSWLKSNRCYIKNFVIENKNLNLRKLVTVL